MATVTPDQFRSVMGSFAAGVTVVTTIDGAGKKWGLTATAFSSVSLDPPLCLVCIGNRVGSQAAFGESRKFGVSMLQAEQEDLSNHFSRKSDDKFSEVPHRAGSLTGCPLIADALANLECEITDIHQAGDHQIMVAKVVSVEVAEGAPLIYWRGGYRKLVAEAS